MDELDKQYNFLFYQSKDGSTKIQVFLDQESETIWTTQKGMGEIFDIDVSGITKHLQNIFDSGELSENSNVQKLHIATSTKRVTFYNLDVIISVGYRVNSQKATDFRIWATSVLKEYMIKGFALDDERLKQGKDAFGKDYFDELLERVREIRASERRFYQKITDIYEQCSIDYDEKSQITKNFFATVQNKLHFAICHHTAAEIIRDRASSAKPNMGLTSWKNEKIGGKILKSDVTVAKNYLNEKELGDLNYFVSQYLDYAEGLARRKIGLTMRDWVDKLDAFLKFNEYEILTNMGNISSDIAKKLAIKEYEKFRIIQDREYKSDYDQFSQAVDEIKITGKLPALGFSIKESQEKQKLSDFNENLNKALNFNPNKNNKKKNKDEKN